MLIKILVRDCRKNKVITAALFIFIMLAALLVASASNTIMGLSSSMKNLFGLSKVPHFVQMHAGDIKQAEIDTFVSGNNLVKAQQTVKMLGIPGANLFLGDSLTSEKDTVMDISFVQQNESFDLLLDLANEVIVVQKGEIAVPIYYMQQQGMNIGDKVKVSSDVLEMEFTVTEFVRDAMMNPALVSSKRFVINESDFESLAAVSFGEVEYLIEFLLTDLAKVGEFSSAYQSSSLPQKGPSIDYKLFKVFNALTDGIVAGVIILVSVLLIAIAVLCLRFTILAAMEEDYREISVMKAIGIAGQDIRRVYATKYTVLAVGASISGYVASLFVNRLLTTNMLLYMGKATPNALHAIVPVFATVLIALIMIFSCNMIMRRFRRITAVEALRSGSVGDGPVSKRLLPLSRHRLLNVNAFLGVKDVLGRFKVFGLLCFVFVISSFIINVPVNFLNTMQSPDFVNYMGTGRSDIRIDLQQSENIVQRFDNIRAYIEKDQDVKKFSPLITCSFKVLGSDGTYENINVEIGDLSVFPFEYLGGTAPANQGEIALSSLNAQGLGKGIGDTLQMIVDGQERALKVSGIYQDVTNGGKTARAQLPYDVATVRWYVVCLDVNSGVDIGAKIDEYAGVFSPAKVTYLEDYLSQTLGATIQQLKLITILTMVLALAVSILITSLFLRMLIAKDSAAIAIMKSLGFSVGDIRLQYLTRALLVLGMGIVIGTIAANTLGQGLISLLWSFMGASKIQFVINSVVAYVLCPLVQIVVVTITALLSIVSMKKASITAMIAE